MTILSVMPFSSFADTIYRQKYAWPGEEWADTAARVSTHVLSALGYKANSAEVSEVTKLIADRKFIPGGRYLYGAGRPYHQVQNCLLLRAEDSREGWADTMRKSTLALMTGAGIGIDYSRLRASGSVIRKTGGTSSGPISLMGGVNEIGRRVMQGGSRRSAIWGGLRWDHPDIESFIALKDWPDVVVKQKLNDFSFPGECDMTNISVILNDAFFRAYKAGDELAHRVYWSTVQSMLSSAEPGFSVDTGVNHGETLRNACTEITSADDSDICNLGSINLARIDSLDEMRHAIELSTLFLLAGTVYSDVPYDEVAVTREKNRRLGLGLMGLHEWLLKRGKRYGPDVELEKWLKVYKTSTKRARAWADQHNLSRSVKTRAVAPTGTIGILGETTTGIEPVLCRAFKRRYLQGTKWVHQYVLDPTTARLVAEGVSPDSVEDAYSIPPDRRLDFQEWVQRFVDHGISSTINLSRVITDPAEVEGFGDMLMNRLPNLRGVTCYPNGSRGGQPLTAVDYADAAKRTGVVLEEAEDRCVGGACGI